jgi:hypothetical protein
MSQQGISLKDGCIVFALKKLKRGGTSEKILWLITNAGQTASEEEACIIMGAAEKQDVIRINKICQSILARRD